MRCGTQPKPHPLLPPPLLLLLLLTLILLLAVIHHRQWSFTGRGRLGLALRRTGSSIFNGGPSGDRGWTGDPRAWGSGSIVDQRRVHHSVQLVSSSAGDRDPGLLSPPPSLVCGRTLATKSCTGGVCLHDTWWLGGVGTPPPTATERGLNRPAPVFFCGYAGTWSATAG